MPVEFKNAVFALCSAAIISGIIKLLAPNGKINGQLSFLISAIFTLMVFDMLGELPFVDGIDLSTEDTAVIDFSDRLSEQARKEAALSVRNKVAQLLDEKSISYEKILVAANINSVFCISITDIELVLNSGYNEEQAGNIADTVQKTVGTDIKVTYRISNSR